MWQSPMWPVTMHIRFLKRREIEETASLEEKNQEGGKIWNSMMRYWTGTVWPERGICISYLLLCNKLSPNIPALNNKHLIVSEGQESRNSWADLSWGCNWVYMWAHGHGWAADLDPFLGSLMWLLAGGPSSLPCGPFCGPVQTWLWLPPGVI